MVKLTPKCLSNKGYGYSAQGYLIPCCWCDPREEYGNEHKDKESRQIKDTFFKEHLKLSNVDEIGDIILSREWTDFYNILIDDPDNALDVCKRFCKTRESTKMIQRHGADLEDSTGIKIRIGVDEP